MKNPKAGIPRWLPLLICPCIAGCSDQDLEIASLKEKTAAATEVMTSLTVSLRQLKQRSSELSGEIRNKANIRKDFEEKAKKSGEVEETFTKYRAELEISVNKLKEEIGKFRQQASPPELFP